jgi:Concanavalin A-like lectin/glucanases superfamily
MSISITGGVTFSGGSLFTVLVVPTDAQFNYVAALFSGEGTNTAQNNTFTDGSTNNFSITRTGTPTQGSFSPYGSNWSNYIAATSSLQAPSGSSISDTGNFTLELWINPTTFASGYQVIYANDTSGGFSFSINSTGTLGYGRSLIATDGTTTGTVTFNQWNHIAFVRSGTGASQFICYINGVSAGSFTNSTSYAAGIVRIGTDGGGSSFPYTGYISNLRSNTTAVYTSAFTPPTAPLTAISGTSLLTCQSNRFIDNSTNNFALTISGTPSVQRFNPFGTSTTYSIGSIGGAGYFNGSTDWLSTPSSGQFAPTGDFTIECWFNIPSLPGTSYELFGNYNANAAQCWEFEITSTGVFNFYTNGAIARIATASGAIKPNTWYHACITRSGTTITGYINGVSVGTYTQSGTFGSTTLPVYIASQNNGSLPFKGYVSDARLVDGTSVYTGNFTPPTAPLGAITGTKLLLNFTNAGIYDNAMMNNAITAGAAQISTTQYKFGSSSISFNGTTGYLTIPSSTLFGYGSGDFTIEMWYYFTGTTSDTRYFFDQRTSAGGSQLAPAVFLNAGVINVYLNGVYAIVGPTVTTNNWNHLALVRSSGVTKLYINGSQAGSNYTDANSYVASSMTIGATPAAVNTYNWSGYIDDFRVTNGYARYTSNFTAPTAAFPTVGPVAIVPPPTTIEYLVVAGGGSGTGGDVGTAVPGGAGGAGGVVSQTTFNIAASTLYTITVGAGGTYVPTNGVASQLANPGNDSSINNLVVAKGGGGGGYYRTGGSGGSGGSGGYNGSAAGTSNQSSAGTIPAGATGYGNSGVVGPGLLGGSGGGGGAGAAGTALNGANGTAGGVGITSTIITTAQATTNSIGEVVSTSVYFAGGGGGGVNYNGAGTFGPGGSGGGGKGGTTSLAAASGSPNTGGGGGSAPNTITGGSGGSGVVIIKYADTYAVASSTTGSPIIIASGGYRIYIFTTSGSITF